MSLHLSCPNGCREGRFEALNAPLYVDSAGGYAGHDGGHATYVCAVCASVALDIAAAAAEMHRQEDTAAVLTCPSCSLEMLPPDGDPLASLLECPACGTRFAVEEGLRRLHGGAPGGGEGSEGNGWS